MSPCVCSFLQQASVATASPHHPGRRCATVSQSSPFQSASLRPTSRQQRRGSVVNYAQCRTVRAAAAAEVGKEIAKSEIPAFIPRQDLMDQLTRWAYTEVQEESMRKFGLAVKVSLSLAAPAFSHLTKLSSLVLPCTKLKRGIPQVQRTTHEGIPWGFVSSILRDGATVTDISVSFDLENTRKYDWVGRNADGFPIMEGASEDILGKHFVIR